MIGTTSSIITFHKILSSNQNSSFLAHMPLFLVFVFLYYHYFNTLSLCLSPIFQMEEIAFCFVSFYDELLSGGEVYIVSQCVVHECM